MMESEQLNLFSLPLFCNALILYIQQRMAKKIKSKQCKGRWCGIHLFSIKPKFQKDWKTKDQTVRLCPKYDNSKQLLGSSPEINQDKKYYTPLFIASEDHKYYIECDERTRTIFQNNRKKQGSEKSEIMVANVISTHKYCKVCKLDYEDYLEHVSSQMHHDKAIKNPYSTYISELQQLIQTSQKRQIENLLEKRSLVTNVQNYSEFQMDLQLSQKQSRIKEIFFEENFSQKRE